MKTGIQDELRQAYDSRTTLMSRAPATFRDRLDTVRKALIRFPPPPGAAVRLLVKERASGYWLALQDSLSIGADAANGLQLSCDYVSAHHCRLVETNDLWRIMDLDSANGVYVNGTRMSGERFLKNGDIVQVGTVTMIIILPTDQGCHVNE